MSQRQAQHEKEQTLLHDLQEEPRLNLAEEEQEPMQKPWGLGQQDLHGKPWDWVQDVKQLLQGQAQKLREQHEEDAWAGLLHGEEAEPDSGGYCSGGADQAMGMAVQDVACS